MEEGVVDHFSNLGDGYGYGIGHFGGFDVVILDWDSSDRFVARFCTNKRGLYF